MASSAPPSALTVTSPHTQQLNNSSAATFSLSFKPPFFSLPHDNGSLSKSLVAAAVAAEASEPQQDDGGAAVAVKPKKGKAGLPLKRVRFGGNLTDEVKEIFGNSEIERNKKEYDLKTAIPLLKQTAGTKFVETVEAHFCLNIDPKYND